MSSNGRLTGVHTSDTGIVCDSCGSPVSSAAAQACRGLSHVNAVSAVAIEQQFHVKLKDLFLCAECFLAMYWMVTAPGGLPSGSPEQPDPDASA